MTPIKFHAKARAEYRQAVEFYKGEGARIARDFAIDARAALSLIGSFPASGAPDENGARHARLRRFPVTIVYHLEDDVVEIVAFAHQRRKPGYWGTRM